MESLPSPHRSLAQDYSRFESWDPPDSVLFVQTVLDPLFREVRAYLEKEWDE